MARIEREITADPVPRRTSAKEIDSLLRDVFEETRPKYGRQLGRWRLVAAVPLVVAAIWLGNFLVNPLRFDQGRVTDVAAALGNGAGYRSASMKIDHRGLKLAQVSAFADAPELVVLGGTPWREVHGNLLWDADYFNAWVPAPDVADLRGLIGALRQGERMPERIVLSVGPGTLRSPGGGMPRWLVQFSPLALGEGVLRSFEGPAEGLTLQTARPEGWVLLPDGSAVAPEPWVAAGDGALLAFSAAASHSGGGIDINAGSVAALDRLVGALTDAGVEVVLAHPPVHPRFWESVQGSAYHRGLDSVTAATQQLAERHEVPVLGGFDPAVLGCEAAMFRDAFHASPACLSQVIEQVVAPPAR